MIQANWLLDSGDLHGGFVVTLSIWSWILQSDHYNRLSDCTYYLLLVSAVWWRNWTLFDIVYLTIHCRIHHIFVKKISALIESISKWSNARLNGQHDYETTLICKLQKRSICKFPYLVQNQSGNNCKLPYLVQNQSGNNCNFPYIVQNQSGNCCFLAV